MAIPVEVKNEVEVGKSLRSQTCGIEYNASVVKTVTSNLYDYKKEAVVREYSTNITDSHNDSGKRALQGYVHVPTKMNPVIEFHDYGLGMTEDTIHNTFSVLGKSTKRGDNNTNGSLGFGSKSYGTVCDHMTVTSFKDGVKTVVICYKDKTGMLTADTKSITPTDQPNGSIISIPVKPSEVTDWQEICARVLGAFEVPHKVNSFGGFQDVFDDVHKVCNQAREKGSVFIQSPNYNLQCHRSTVNVLMGDVLYHLPEFKNLVGESKAKTLVEQMVSNGFYIAHFNIGDLDHAPSRESISYDSQTLLRVKRKVNRDVNVYVKDFMNTCDVGGDLSLYKFYKQFRNSPAWDVLKEMTFSFTGGYHLKRLCPREYYGSKIMPLLNKEKYGTVKGFVPHVGNLSGDTATYSSSVDSLYQDRLFNINTPIICYSEKEKGLYKIKITLENVQLHHDVKHVLVCEDKTKALNVAKWFGVEGAFVICADSYSPEKEKVSRKGNSASSRSSFGIKFDWETVGRVIDMTTTTNYKDSTTKINLSEEGVAYVPTEEITIKGVVKGEQTTFSLSTRTILKFMNLLGLKKVVFMNLNNKGKITRSGCPNIEDLLVEYVKNHKQDLVKYLAWKDEHRFHDKEKVIAGLLPSYRTYKSRVEQIKTQVNPNIETLASISRFGLTNTKMYGKYTETKSKLERKVVGDVNNTLAKLPLADKFNCYTEKDIDNFKYYLKLEKVIK